MNPATPLFCTWDEAGVQPVDVISLTAPVGKIADQRDPLVSVNAHSDRYRRLPATK